MFKKPGVSPIKARPNASRKAFAAAAILFGALALFTGGMSPATAQIAAGGAQPVGTNADYSEQTFTDLFAQPSIVGSNGAALGVNSTDYWPSTDFEFVLDNRFTFAWLSPVPAYADPLRRSTNLGGAYALSFTGSATIADVGNDPAHGGNTITNQVYNSSTNTTTATVNVANPSGGVLIDLRFSNTKRTSGSAVGTGVTNVHLIKPGYTQSQTFTNEWLAATSSGSIPWSSARQMDNLGTNNYASPSSVEVYPYSLQWADRVLPVTATSGPCYGNLHAAGQHGYPWEYVILQANATMVNPWINIPVNASDAYITSLATLLKNGDAFTNNVGINSSLHIYLEYSNEMWHYGFNQGSWNNTKATDEVHAGGSNLNYDGTTSTDAWRFRRFAKRTIEITNIFKTVFAGTQLRPVINNASIGNDLDMLRYVQANYGPPANFLYGISTATYITGTDFSSTAAIQNGMMADADAQSAAGASWQQQRAIATFFGIKSMSYEGGEGYGGNDSNSQNFSSNLFAATRDVGMQTVYTHYLQDWFKAGGDLINQFTLAGKWSTYGWWAASEDLTVGTGGKWVGLKNQANAAAPGVTAGVALSATNGATTTLISNVGCFGNPGVTQPTTNTVLLNVPGNYAYTFLVGGTGNNDYQVKFEVDNVVIGSPTATPTGIPGVPTTLTPGLHTLIITWPIPSTVHVCLGALTVTNNGAVGGIPPVPTGLTATAGNTQVALNWSASAGATAYDVKRSTVSGSGYVTVSSPATTSYTNTGLTNGTTYYFVVDAKNASGTSANSSQVSATPQPAIPPVPTGLAATPGNAQVALTWNASTGATAYDVKRSTVSGSGYVTVSSPTSTSYTNTGLTNGTTYYFVVDAKNASGTSANSSQVSATPSAGGGGGNLIQDPGFEAQTAWTAPAAPWSKEGAGTVGIEPGTTAHTGANGVSIYAGGTGWSAVLQTVAVTANTSYTLTGWANSATATPGVLLGARTTGGTILGQVTAGVNGWTQSTVTFNSGSNTSIVVFFGFNVASGDWMHIDDLSLTANGGSAPPAPTGLTASPGNTQVTLHWNASTGATAYDVKRSTVSGSGYVTVSSPTTTSYINTGLTNGTTYYFVVDAKNATGTSANSAQASAVPSVGGLILDPGFEGQTGWAQLVAPWSKEGAGTVQTETGSTAHTGLIGVSIFASGTGWSAAKQTVTVLANTSYTLTGWGNSGGAVTGALLGARTTGGTVLGQVSASVAGWTQNSVTFNTGANTSIVVFFGYNVATGTWMHLDDLSLTAN